MIRIKLLLCTAAVAGMPVWAAANGRVPADATAYSPGIVQPQRESLRNSLRNREAQAVRETRQLSEQERRELRQQIRDQRQERTAANP